MQGQIRNCIKVQMPGLGEGDIQPALHLKHHRVVLPRAARDGEGDVGEGVVRKYGFRQLIPGLRPAHRLRRSALVECDGGDVRVVVGVQRVAGAAEQGEGEGFVPFCSALIAEHAHAEAGLAGGDGIAFGIGIGIHHLHVVQHHIHADLHLGVVG